MNQYLISIFPRIKSRLILPVLLTASLILAACVGTVNLSGNQIGTKNSDDTENDTEDQDDTKINVEIDVPSSLVPIVRRIREFITPPPVVAGCTDDDKSAKCVVNFADWTGSFTTTPPTEADISALIIKNEFLAGGTDALDETGLTVTNGNSGSLNLNSANFDGKAIGGDINDGVAFFTAQQNNVDYYYAGLLSDTDLGALLGTPPAGELTKARWNGRFQVIGANPIDTDFVLEVDFGTAKSIEALVKLTDDFDDINHYFLTGTYDENGVITGNVNYGQFTADYEVFLDSNQMPSLIPVLKGSERAPDAVVTGLIGAEGAVGVFVSGTGNKNAIVGGIDTDGFTGGFVASPTVTFNPDVVNFNTWATSFINPPSTQRNAIFPYNSYTPVDTRINQFLAGDRDSLAAPLNSSVLPKVTVGERTAGSLDLSQGSLDAFIDASSKPRDRGYVPGLPLGGDATDGVAFFETHRNNGHYSYAGLFSGTDLGAPLTQSNGTAYWKGLLTVSDQGYAGRHHKYDFILKITFGGAGSGGSIKALETDGVTDYLSMVGTYDAKGVITGTLDAKTPISRTDDFLSRPGILTGLIGQEGAVGAFVAGRGTKNQVIHDSQNIDTNYSGGFVAVAPSYDKVVNQSDWAHNFTNAPPTIADIAVATRRNQFLSGSETTLSPTGLTNPTAIKALDLSTATFDSTDDSTDNGTSLGGLATNGVAFFSGTNGANHFYAGLLADINLGTPLTETGGTAKWKGQFQAVGLVRELTDFTLEINFGTQKIETFVLRSANEYYHLKGDYSDSGVITGTVDYGAFTSNDKTAPTGTRYPGVLTGLIGQDGAVGAFVSGTGDNNTITGGEGINGYAGGFVACPLHSDGQCMSATR